MDVIFGCSDNIVDINRSYEPGEQSQYCVRLREPPCRLLRMMTLIGADATKELNLNGVGLILNAAPTCSRLPSKVQRSTPTSRSWTTPPSIDLSSQVRITREEIRDLAELQVPTPKQPTESRRQYTSAAHDFSGCGKPESRRRSKYLTHGLIDPAQ